MNLQVKKSIALALVSAYILFTAWEVMYLNKPISESFRTVATMVVAYYFGRSHGKEDLNANN